MTIFGARECIAAIEGIKAKTEAASMNIVRRSEMHLEAEIKKGFTKSHPRNTPTPAAPGEPPAVVTGTLRRSVKSTSPIPLGSGGASGKVYPTAVYARIQELGGGAIPGRPYVGPAYSRSTGKFHDIANEEWRMSTRA